MLLAPDKQRIPTNYPCVHWEPSEGAKVQENLRNEDSPDRLLTASEVADLFRVSSKTVGRWGRSGALPLYRTIGGHHRYRLCDVRAFPDLETEAVDAEA